MKTGEFIRLFRESKGLGLRKTAKMVGRSHVFLGDIERGNCRLPRELVKPLAEALGMIDIDLLLRLSEEVPMMVDLTKVSDEERVDVIVTLMAIGAI